MRIGELAARAGTTVRTVRYYVARGLLPPPVGGGRGSIYTFEHLARLGAIQTLKRRFLPLDEIGRHLAAMTSEEIEALAAAPAEPVEVVDAVGRPLGVLGPDGGLAAGRPVALLGRGGEPFLLPSARGTPVLRGTASSVPLPRVGSNLWQRVLLAPGVELSFQLSGDAERDRAVADLVEEATRRLAGFVPTPPEEER